MYRQRVLVLVALAVLSVSTAVSLIFASGSTPRDVSASAMNSNHHEGSAYPAPLAENSGLVAATLPLFQRLDQNYVRGAEPASGGVETLTRLGIRTVVDLRSIYDHTDGLGLAVESAGLRYYWLPMGVWDPPSDAQAREFVSVVSEESQGPFYVFCADGQHRTGEMSAIYRIAHCGWSVEQALREMDSVGFNPYYYSLRSYVWAYARKYHPRKVPLHARRVSAFE